MRGLSRRIMEHAEALPENAPMCPATLLHLRNLVVVDHALSRYAHSGRLMRIYQGFYKRRIETPLDPRSPRVAKAIIALSERMGETIVPCGGVSSRTGVNRRAPDRHDRGADRLGECDRDACLLSPGTCAQRASGEAQAGPRPLRRSQHRGERSCRSRACPFRLLPQGSILC